MKILQTLNSGIGRLSIFLILNFMALALGGMSTTKAVQGDWYAQLSKAPWTPPGWVFGAAWTFIMISFAFYMSLGWKRVQNTKFFVTLYLFQWLLNVLWNPVFFNWHWTGIALLIIISLASLILFFLIYYFKKFKSISLFILPYLIWLLIATSLNAYVVVNN